MAKGKKHRPKEEFRILVTRMVKSLEDTLADPAHTLTLAHRDQLELIYHDSLQLLELTQKPFPQGKSMEIKQANKAPAPVNNSSPIMKNPLPVKAPPSASSRRVLVVDDKIVAAESMAMLLRLHGHEVETAHDGPGAIQAAKAFNPDVVLLDLGLPGMSGYEVAKHLQDEPRQKKMLLVALTGYGLPEDQRRTREAGFDAHLVKPASPQTLASIISLS